MIDGNRVVELRRDVGEADFDEIVQLFLSEVEALLHLLEDPESDTALHMHALKGCALNLGFSTLAALCTEYESSARTRIDLPPIFECYEESRAAFFRGIIRD